MTERLFLTDAYRRRFTATVTIVEDRRVVLDRTTFYATSGGQPNDIGVLRWDATEAAVVDVSSDGMNVWHTIAEGTEPPRPGDEVTGEIDWDRRHQLMRTHSAMHVLCGVIWNEYDKAVTGGNMEPLSARMDFEFAELPEGFAQTIEARVNEEIAADRPIDVSFLDRDVALSDDDLIRTKVNLIPEAVNPVRIVDIVGLDKQADGGTHVHSTREIGTFRVVSTKSKGKGNKRLRIELTD